MSHSRDQQTPEQTTRLISLERPTPPTWQLSRWDTAGWLGAAATRAPGAAGGALPPASVVMTSPEEHLQTEWRRAAAAAGGQAAGLQARCPARMDGGRWRLRGRRQASVACGPDVAVGTFAGRAIVLDRRCFAMRRHKVDGEARCLPVAGGLAGKRQSLCFAVRAWLHLHKTRVGKFKGRTLLTEDAEVLSQVNELPRW